MSYIDIELGYTGMEEHSRLIILTGKIRRNVGHWIEIFSTKQDLAKRPASRQIQECAPSMFLGINNLRSPCCAKVLENAKSPLERLKKMPKAPGHSQRTSVYGPHKRVEFSPA